MSTRPHAQPAPSTCSASSARLDEPLAGTAPLATSWLAIEQPGPWGARALTQSHFDPELGAQLNRLADGTGVRIALIRRVGHHALHGAGEARRILIATTRPGASGIRSLTVTDPRALLDLDFAAIGAGRVEAGDVHPDPVILVCTNAKRDQCCAVSGRALALDLCGADGMAELWEADHLGGHRFAPTAVVLPTGYVYGRLDTATARATVDGAGRGQVVPDRCRGRSTWSRTGQAADLALRDELQEFGADAVRVLGESALDDGHWSVDLIVGADNAADDGARYRVVVEQSAAQEPRPESCGKPFGNPLELRVVEIEKVEEPAATG